MSTSAAQHIFEAAKARAGNRPLGLFQRAGEVSVRRHQVSAGGTEENSRELAFRKIAGAIWRTLPNGLGVEGTSPQACGRGPETADILRRKP